MSAFVLVYVSACVGVGTCVDSYVGACVCVRVCAFVRVWANVCMCVCVGGGVGGGGC